MDLHARALVVYQPGGTLTTNSIWYAVSTVSLTTVQFESDGDGTRLVLTEQGTFLDDQEQPEWREQGTADWLDALGRLVSQR